VKIDLDQKPVDSALIAIEEAALEIAWIPIDQHPAQIENYGLIT
jgi:hypothetical protein